MATFIIYKGYNVPYIWRSAPQQASDIDSSTLMYPRHPAAVASRDFSYCRKWYQLSGPRRYALKGTSGHHASFSTGTLAQNVMDGIKTNPPSRPNISLLLLYGDVSRPVPRQYLRVGLLPRKSATAARFLFQPPEVLNVFGMALNRIDNVRSFGNQVK